MKLWGVSMVRNEEDIVEAFVRHNLTILDGLLVVDHLSSDRTLKILVALAAERLPIVVTRSESPGRLHSEVATTAARQVFERSAADAVFPLDADEFLDAPSRPLLERALAGIPPGHAGLLSWPTFVPPFDRAGADLVAIARSAKRLANEAPRPDEFSGKVVLTRELMAVPETYLAMGGHGVVVGRKAATLRRVKHVDLPPEVVRLCHLPVRSRAQYAIKTAVLNLALMAAGRGYRAGSPRMREFERLRDGGALTPFAMLRTYVQQPGDGAASAELETVDDAFLAPIELRYTPAPPTDPLPPILAAIEQMVHRLSHSS